MFYFDIPRLSVDIDINFIGYEKKNDMVKIRPEFEKEIENILRKENFDIRGKHNDYALTSYHLRYKSFNSNLGNLKIDINYMMRIPIYKIDKMDSKGINVFNAKKIPVLNKDELFASKLIAAFARNASRDIYDIYNLLKNVDYFNFKKVKQAFIIYAAMNSFDFRKISKKDLYINERDFKNKLIPVEKSKSRIKEKEFYDELEKTCERIIDLVLPYKEDELRFLNNIYDKGIIVPEIITDDETLQNKIKIQPQFLWKCQNIKYKNN